MPRSMKSRHHRRLSGVALGKHLAEKDERDFFRGAYGTVLHHKVLRNADGTPVRLRVNGKVKTWKKRPGEYSIPAKHGMYEYVRVGNTGFDDVPLDAVYLEE